MNYRKDIYEKVKFMLKEKDGIKLNYAKLGRQYNCDPRTIKKYVEQVKRDACCTDDQIQSDCTYFKFRE